MNSGIATNSAYLLGNSRPGLPKVLCRVGLEPRDQILCNGVSKQ